MKQQQKAQKAKKGLVTTTIVSTVLTAAMVAGIGAFVGLNFNTVKAIFNGETMITQSDAEALIDTAKVEGYNSGFETGLSEAKYIENRINVGDFIDGYYYNTAFTPDFAKLDWSKADFTINKGEPEKSLQFPAFDEINVMYLVTSFDHTNIKTFEEYRTHQERVQLQVWRIKNDTTITYALLQHGSNGVYVGITEWQPIGWRRSGNVKDPLDGSQGETAVYVNDQQRIWGNWVSKNRLLPQALITNKLPLNNPNSLYVNTSASDEIISKSLQAYIGTDNTPTYEAGIMMIPIREFDVDADGYVVVIFIEGRHEIGTKDQMIPLYSSIALENIGLNDDGQLMLNAVAGWQNIGADGKITFPGIGNLLLWGDIGGEETNQYYNLIARAPFSATPMYDYNK